MMARIFLLGNVGPVSSNVVLLVAGLLHRERSVGQGEKMVTTCDGYGRPSSICRWVSVIRRRGLCTSHSFQAGQNAAITFCVVEGEGVYLSQS